MPNLATAQLLQRHAGEKTDLVDLNTQGRAEGAYVDRLEAELTKARTTLAWLGNNKCAERGLDADAVDMRRKHHLQKRPSELLPGCGGSDVLMREGRTYALRDYAAGEIVEVSRG